jgi:hypothetical protein
MTDELSPLGMHDEEAERAHAAIRRLVKECFAVTGERFRRGERPKLGPVARNTVITMRGALVGLGLSVKQREVFLLVAVAELLKISLRNLEGTTTKRRVN